MKSYQLKILSFFLFVLIFFIGIQLAQNKPLWNDEIYSQTGPIQNQSYAEMLAGKIEEGSNTPLFYIIQKTLCLLTRYQLSISEASWFVVDLKSQVLLRLFPNLYMALALTCIFYFFSRYYSLWWGCYAVLVSFSSPMIWRYWVEARPYSLWIFLMVIDIILFLVMVKDEKKAKSLWVWLIVTHILMAFTAVFSLAQIGIVSILLWGFGKEKKALEIPKKYFLGTALAIGIGLFYYTQAPKYHFWFDPQNPPWKLLTDCFPVENMWICGGYLIFYLFIFFIKKEKYAEFRQGQYGLSFLVLTSLSALVLMSIFIIKVV